MTPSHASWPRRALACSGVALSLAGLAALGWLWHLDRARVRETPRLGGPLVLLRACPVAPEARTWLVAVNPGCPHCRQVLVRLANRPPAGVRVGALIVDTRRRPSAVTLRSLPGAPIWWDASNAWRRRWGHRVYGEVIRFDAAGRYASTRIELPTP
ncbi:MAG TPA: hypothetical protein VMS88_02880 [Terriglobales bacterium]|nr:hypothetical protein [Terriglobales bacterium]